MFAGLAGGAYIPTKGVVTYAPPAPQGTKETETQMKERKFNQEAAKLHELLPITEVIVGPMAHQAVTDNPTATPAAQSRPNSTAKNSRTRPGNSSATAASSGEANAGTASERRHRRQPDKGGRKKDVAAEARKYEGALRTYTFSDTVSQSVKLSSFISNNL
ncbi:MAG: hypothetical protein ACLQVL_08760 [Terriglobia bacterium]